MTVQTGHGHVAPSSKGPPGENYLTADYGFKSWLLTTDHKRIGLLYLISISFFFLLGGVFAVAIRLELLTPEGDMFDTDSYNKLFTQHGVFMVFFFLLPSIPAVLGNFLLPLMLLASRLIAGLAFIAGPDQWERAEPRNKRGVPTLGSVWEAEHCQIGNRVAIKVLTRDVGADANKEASSL